MNQAKESDSTHEQFQGSGREVERAIQARGVSEFLQSDVAVRAMRSEGRDPLDDPRGDAGDLWERAVPAYVVGHMVTHAPEPICKFCGEDRPAMVDKSRTRCHCKVCGKSWPIAVAAVSVPMEGGATGP